MDAVVVDRRVVVEDVLGAVAVVHVEVHDAHPVDAELLLDVAGGDRHVVEVAKPHGAADFRVMPGRPHRAEGVVQPALP